VPQAHELTRAVAPQVDVAILPAQGLLDRRLLVHIERRGLRLVQHGDGLGGHLDPACRKLVVDGLGRALADRPGDLEHPLVAHVAERVVDRIAGLRHDLGDPPAVAQVDERQSAEVPPPMDPAGQRDVLPRRGGCELAAGVRAQHLLSLAGP
jgi:hypothetical protein